MVGSKRAQLRSIVGVADAVLRVADGIVDVARALAETAPRPRGEPYFGLDVQADYDLSSVDVLTARGMFRKYELALELDCGLGGRARWLASRAGCRVVGVDGLAAMVQAADELCRRAHMSTQVSYAAGLSGALGFSAESFTQVWLFDAELDDSFFATANEAMRVLRKGGRFLFQIDAGNQAVLAVMPRLQALGAADLEVREVRLSELSALARRGRAQLQQAMQRCWPEARICESLWERRQQRVAVQVLGRRPT